MSHIDATAKGTTSNSYVTLSEANTLAALQMPALAAAWVTIANDDEREVRLIDAAKELDNRWNWLGLQKTNTQAMAWPRNQVLKLGFDMRYRSGSTSNGFKMSDKYDHNHSHGGLGLFDFTSDAYLDSDTIPAFLQKAQLLIAIHKSQGKNLYEGTRGDVTKASVAGINAEFASQVATAEHIFLETRKYGIFNAGSGLPPQLSMGGIA